MDVLRAREQLRRRYLFPPDAEVPLEHEGYPRPETSTAVEKKEKPLPRLNIHSGFWILASIVVTYYVDFFQTVKENFHTSSFNVALWHVWSFFTPLLLFTQFMGVVMLTSLLG